MPQWECEKINLGYLPRKTDEIDVLDDAGKDGWELVAITPNNIAYLKRPVTLAKRRALKSAQESGAGGQKIP